MNRIHDVFYNAIARFGMDRRARRKSTLSLLLTSVIGISLILLFVFSIESYSGMNSSALAEIGQYSFAAVAITHAIIVVLMSAISASGEITGERDRQTMDLLVCSQMTPGQIIFGKLLSSFSFSLLLSISMLPVYAVIYLFGGITPAIVFSVFGLMIFITFTVTCVALCFSSLMKKTAAAMLMTIFLFGLLIFGNLFAELMMELIADAVRTNFGVRIYGYNDVPWIVRFNPAYFIYVILEGLIEGWDFLTNAILQDKIGYIITLTFTPALFILMSIGSFLIARKKIDPLRANPRKG